MAACAVCFVIGLESGRLGAARHAHRRAAWRARLPRGQRFLPVRDRAPGRRRPAVGAVGGRGRHDDQPRGPRDPAAARRRAAARRAHRPADPERSRARAGVGRRAFPASPRVVLDELRGATAGAPADYSGITPSRIDREQRRLLAVPIDRTHPGTPRLFADRFHTPNGRARFHRVRAVRSRPSGPTPTTRSTSRPVACWRSTSPARRRDGSIGCCQRGARARGGDAPARREALGLDRRRRRSRSRRAAAAPRSGCGRRTASARTPSSCRFTGPGSSRRTG